MSGLGFVTALAVGSLFIASGVAKVLSGGFARDLANYRILPRATVPAVARVLPWLEIVLGVAVLTLPDPAVALVIAAFLLAGYTTAVVWNLARGRRIPCGCHGSSRPISWWLAASDLSWLAVATLAAAATTSPTVVLIGADGDLSASDGLALFLLLVVAGGVVRIVPAARALRAATDRVERIIASGAVS